MDEQFKNNVTNPLITLSQRPLPSVVRNCFWVLLAGKLICELSCMGSASQHLAVRMKIIKKLGDYNFV
jgi:hypothetical protein